LFFEIVTNRLPFACLLPKLNPAANVLNVSTPIPVQTFWSGGILTQIEVYTINESAELLKCSPALVRSLIASGQLVATNLSLGSKHKNYRITGSAIARYLEGATVPVRSVRTAPKVYGKPFLKCNGA
jgi:hypothetical protein